jgi:hypothetical protein
MNKQHLWEIQEMLTKFWQENAMGRDGWKNCKTALRVWEVLSGE